MPDGSFPESRGLPVAVIERIDAVCVRFESAWRSGQQPRIEEYLSVFDEPERTALFEHLLLLDLDYRSRLGETAAPDDYRTRFPEYADVILAAFSKLVASAGIPETISRPCVSTDTATARPAGAEPVDGAAQFDRFQLLKKLGGGAFGVVYQAYDPRLDRYVALKLPRVELPDDEDREQFAREARAAAQLRHPHIVPVHETGEIDGRRYIVSDFVEGETLRQHIKRRGRFPCREAAVLVARLARALHYAHGKGIVHRDVKPENVMMDAEGEPQVTDFGLAHREQGETLRTQEGMRMGTPAYMSPEQARGQSHLVDGRSDLWSLGVMLYELVTGARPFAGQETELILAILEGDPPPPRRRDRSIPRDIDTICMKCLAKEPDRRYRSCEEFAEDLERYCAGEPIRARRQSPMVRLWRKAARRPVISGLLAAALSVMAAGGWMAWHGIGQRQVALSAAEIDELIGRGTISEPSLAEIDARIAILEKRSPEQAKVRRENLARKLAAQIESDIDGAAYLTSETAADVEARLRALEARDRIASERLTSRLQERLSRWNVFLDLAAPFAGVESAFPNDQVVVVGEAIQSVKGSDQPGFLRTSVSSEGRTALEVVFDESWEGAGRLGIVVDAAGLDAPADEPAPGDSDRCEYRFVIRPVFPARAEEGQSAPRAAASFAEARRREISLLMEIFRGPSCLQRKSLEPDDLAPGALKLKVAREEDRLRFEAGNPDGARLNVVEFQDPFAYRSKTAGTFAILWPSGVRVTHVRGLRRTLPETPSPLEEGDWLFGQSRFSEALAAFEEQARKTDDAETSREARYKSAVCLLALERESEAEELLETLTVEGDGRWRALAACQLWLRYVLRNRFDEADVLFQNLSFVFSPDQMANMIPSELRRGILKGYASQSQSLRLYRPNSNRVRECERAVATDRLLSGSEWTPDSEGLMKNLIRAYRAEGSEETALRKAEEFLAAAPSGRPPAVLVEYAWMLRIAGKPGEALRQLDRWTSRLPDPSRCPVEVVLERVRTLAALGRWEEAESALAPIVQRLEPDTLTGHHQSTWAIQGFLCQQRGDAAAAHAAWKEGLRAEWQLPWFGFHFLQGLILASISDELSDRDAELMVGQVAQWLPEHMRGVARWLAPMEVVTPVLRESFRTPRGRDYARKIVLREIPFEECVRAPPMLLASELIRQGAMGEDMTDEEDELTWRMLGEGYDTVTRGTKIGKPEVIQLAMAWQGTTNLLGWKGVRGKLQPELRGPIAYVMARRYLRLNRRPDAAGFFREALQEAPPGSSLETLARAGWNRLEAKPAPPDAVEAATP